VSHKVTVSIIMPCYNEVSTIEQIIRAVLDSPLEDKEIIIVDDAWRDGTGSKAILASSRVGTLAPIGYGGAGNPVRR
jgi:glycosyltransferase involved in cell wall biosynthesis